MKKLLSVILIFVLAMTAAGCTVKSPADITEFGENDLYKINAATIKPDNYIDGFYYENKYVEIEEHIKTLPHFNKIHMVVKDTEGLFYYLQYNEVRNIVTYVYQSDEQLDLYYKYAYMLCLKKPQSLIYINEAGLFPEVSLNAVIDFYDGFMIVKDNGLKYARAGEVSFTVITELNIVKYKLYKNRMYFVNGNKIFIFDFVTEFIKSFEFSADYYGLQDNGALLIKEYILPVQEDMNGSDYPDNEQYLGYYRHTLIYYDDLYNRIDVVLPEEFQEYTITYYAGHLNIKSMQHKKYGITIYHLFNVGEDFLLKSGEYNEIPNN